MTEEKKLTPYEIFFRDHPRLIAIVVSTLLILIAVSVILTWFGVIKINFKDGVIERTGTTTEVVDNKKDCVAKISELGNEIDSLLSNVLLPYQYSQLNNKTERLKVDNDIIRLCIIKYSVLENEKVECDINSIAPNYTSTKSQINQIAKNYE